jgi:hypothetical protein
MRWRALALGPGCCWPAAGLAVVGAASSACWARSSADRALADELLRLERASGQRRQRHRGHRRRIAAGREPLGDWPYPRSVYALMLDYLRQVGRVRW